LLPCPAIVGGTAAQSEHDIAHPAIEHLPQQLAHADRRPPTYRRRHAGGFCNAHHFGNFDDGDGFAVPLRDAKLCVAVREPGAPHPRLQSFAAGIPMQTRIQCAFAAIRHRQQTTHRIRPHAPQALRHRLRGFDGGQRSFEGIRRDNNDAMRRHGRQIRGSDR